MAITTVYNELIAVNAISGTLIADNAITSVHIATNAVSGILIADNAVTTVHIAANNVTSTSIVANAITSTQLADNAVIATKIPDGIIATAHLADNAVTAAKIPDNVLTATMLPDNVILATHIPSNITLTTSGALTTTGAFTSLGIDDNADAVAITIDSSERVGIGTTSPQKDFVVSNAGAEGFEVDAGATSNLSEIVVYNRSGSAWNTLRHSALAHEFYVSGSEKMKLDSSGNVTMAGTLGLVGNLNFTAADGKNITAQESLIIDIDLNDNDSSRVFTVRSGAGGSAETLINASEDAGVSLYYDNAAKLATVTGGVDITGLLTIDQNANAHALSIDTEATSGQGIYMAGAQTTGSGIMMDMNSLTTGSVISANSNSSSTATRNLVAIVNDHASATGTTALLIRQDSNNLAINIDNASTATASFYMTSKYGMQIVQDIGGGKAARFERNIAEAGSQPLVEIINDHTSNTQASLNIQQDGSVGAVSIAIGTAPEIPVDIHRQ